MHPNFGQVRSILSQPPSSETFESLIDALPLFDIEFTTEHELFVYASQHLERWPTHILRPLTPSILHASDPDHISCATQLCNCITTSILSDDDLTTQCTPKTFCKVTTLLFDQTYFDDVRDNHLISSDGPLPQLTTIKLCSPTLPIYAERLFLSLAQSSRLKQLTTLNIGFTDVSKQTLDLFFQSPHFPQHLTHLDLQHTPTLHSEHILYLVRSNTLQHLTHLDLRLNNLSTELYTEIASSTQFPSLEWLAISHPNITPEAIRALAKSTTLHPQISRYWRALQ